MTPEQINRLMAENVMGWILKEGWRPNWIKGLNVTAWSDNPDSSWYFDPYHRIEHAMMALEKVRKHGYYLVLSQNGFSKEWIAKLVNPDNPEKDVMAFDDTAPAAICLACIEAKKLEERDDTD